MLNKVLYNTKEGKSKINLAKSKNYIYTVYTLNKITFILIIGG